MYWRARHRGSCKGAESVTASDGLGLVESVSVTYLGSRGRTLTTLNTPPNPRSSCVCTSLVSKRLRGRLVKCKSRLASWLQCFSGNMPSFCIPGFYSIGLRSPATWHLKSVPVDSHRCCFFDGSVSLPLATPYPCILRLSSSTEVSHLHLTNTILP